MVTAVTSFGRSGLYDWLIQRVGAVILTAYTIFLVVYIAMNPDLDFARWSALYNQLWMRIFSLLALISFITHAWIGLWSVLTDYLTNRLLGAKATVLRLIAQTVLGVAAVTYLVWGVEILWGF